MVRRNHTPAKHVHGDTTQAAANRLTLMLAEKPIADSDAAETLSRGKRDGTRAKKEKKQRQKASDGCTCYWAKAQIVQECGGQTCSSKLHPPILSRWHGWRDCVVQSFRVKLDDLVPLNGLG